MRVCEFKSHINKALNTLDLKDTLLPHFWSSSIDIEAQLWQILRCYSPLKQVTDTPENFIVSQLELVKKFVGLVCRI